jgi:hypothetical protein
MWVKIDYSLRRIHLPEYTITIKTIKKQNLYDNKMSRSSGLLHGFKNLWDFHKFLKSDWQKETLRNFKLISKSVELFNQALLVDSNSEFLIRYNIIEICGKKSDTDNIWSFKLNQIELDHFFDEIKLTEVSHIVIA